MQEISIRQAWKNIRGRQYLADLIRWTHKPTDVQDLNDLVQNIPDAVLYDGIRFRGAAGAICWVEYGRRRGFTTGMYTESVVDGTMTLRFDASSPALTERPVYRN